ncbi:MAG: RNA polymerase sigma factor [Acidobacteriota bacterium]
MTESLLRHWLRKAKRGNERAFKALVEATRERLFWPVRRMVGTDEDAEEILQEAYMALWRESGKRLPDRPDAWLYRSCINRAIDRCRRMETTRVNLEKVARQLESRRAARRDALGVVKKGEVEEVLAQSLDLLGTRERAVFILRALEEWPFSRIAELMAISDSTARNQFMHARRKVADVFRSRGLEL